MENEQSPFVHDSEEVIFQPPRRRLFQNRQDLLIIIAFCVSNFFVQLFYSLMTAFYPTEATDKKHVRFETMGMIIGIYELSLVVTAPILGRFLTTIGTKFMFITGHFVCGAGSVLFGIMEWCPPGTGYVALSLLIRIIEGAGGAAISTASFAMIGHRFPDRVALLFGTLEMFCGLGMIIGPVVGVLLFNLGGFWVPFVACGVLLVFVGFLCLFLVPSMQVTDSTNEDANSVCSVSGLLRMPLVAITGTNVVMGSAAIGFMTATLEQELQKTYHITKEIYIGLICVVGPCFYMLLGPFWGKMADARPKWSSCLVVCGYLCASLAFLFMGPAPFLHLTPTQTGPWVLIAAQALLGGGIASFVVTFRIIAKAASERYSESLKTFGVVAGLFNSFFSCGAFAGPLVGASLYGNIGFGWGTFIMGCLVLASASLLFCYSTCRRCCHPRPSQTEADIPSDRSPLVVN